MKKIRTAKRLITTLTLAGLLFAGCARNNPMSSTNLEEKVNTPPIVNIIVNKQSGPIPLTVQYTANAFDTDGKVARYEWDFNGDGKTDATGQSAQHTYTKEGIYNARLTAYDDEGASATETMLIKAEYNCTGKVE